MLLCGNTVVKAAVVLHWCIMYQSVSKSIILSHKMYSFHYIEEFLCLSIKFLCNFMQNWAISGEVEKQTFSPCMLAGLWDVSFQLVTALLFYCNSISSRVYFSYIWKLSWKIKIRKVDCLNEHDRQPTRPHPPGWHNASEMTQSSPWCYCKNEDQFQFSVFCCRVIFPLHTLPLGQVLNSLCNLPLYLAKKNNSDLMLGHDLEYLRNYKMRLRLKIVMLRFFFTPRLVILLSM